MSIPHLQPGQYLFKEVVVEVGGLEIDVLLHMLIAAALMILVTATRLAAHEVATE